MPTQFGLFGHEMVSIGYDLIVMGGDIGGGSFSGSIYRLSCSNFVCKWEKLQMELKVPRGAWRANMLIAGALPALSRRLFIAGILQNMKMTKKGSMSRG